ncbi:hypothetical protein GGF50DRAFT_116317 [Schizophyllum commune]
MVGLGPAFERLVVTKTDLVIATFFFGWTAGRMILGFGYFVGLHCVREVVRARRRLNTYLFLIWGELLACLVYGLIIYLYLYEIIQPSFAYFFGAIVVWTFQVQLLLQIICNRIGILMTSPRQRICLKLGVAFLIFLVNVSVFVVWVPAKIGASEAFVRTNKWWDRVEKVIYLTIDMSLNSYFILTVKRRLVSYGLKRYDALVRYNAYIAVVSCTMDVFIICMMSLKNDFVYNQVHPVAYLVKLNIELAMADLIRKVASSTGIHVYDEESSASGGTSGPRSGGGYRARTNGPMEVHIGTEVMTTHDQGVPLEELDSKRGGGKMTSGTASEVWEGTDVDKR